MLSKDNSIDETSSGGIAKKYPTNWHLSTARAGEVTRFLIEQGVMAGRLVAGGYAEQWPQKANYITRRMGKINKTYIDQANLTRENRQANRRIKIVFQTRKL